MIVGACGFTSTGSSAVSDYLKEFETTSTLDNFEFVLSYFPDGLEDLDYQLNRNCSKYSSSVIAIERFKMHVYNYFINRNIEREKKKRIEFALNEFIDKIVQIEWNGYGSADFQLYSGMNYRSKYSLYRYKIGVKLASHTPLTFPLNFFPIRKMQFSICPNKFEEYAKNFVMKIIEIFGGDKTKTIVLDQPFSGNNPRKSFKYFDDPLAIVVDRDPRDVYLFIKKFLKGIGRQTPTNSVDNFIHFYKLLRENQPYKNIDPSVLNINFEDLVYDYDKTTKRITDFCKLDINTRDKVIFDPGLSINNTQLFRRFSDYHKDILKIEKELPNYLYPFEDNIRITNKGQMFFGKSPLNR